MTEPTPPTSAFAVPETVAALVRDGVVDAELASLLSLTIEGAIPLAVAGAGDRLAARDALLPLLPPGLATVRLAGAEETFAWMPEAGELGWRGSSNRARPTPGAVMIASLEDAPGGTWGEAAHLAIRALTVGYSLLATADGAGLEDVLRRLALPPVGAADDELARLGVVLVLGAGGRVEVAHYLRPVARDPGGHVQRLPPAALAAWDRRASRYDHFAWGVTGELAARTGRQPLAFEREHARRTAAISSAAGGA